VSDIITIQKQNEVWCRVDCELGIKYEINDHFQFQVPNYKFTPAYKLGAWDGMIHMFNPLKSLLHVGLVDKLKEFCKTRDYQLVFKDDHTYGLPNEVNVITFEKAKEFVDSLNIHSKGVKLNIHDYQYDAIFASLKNYRRIVLSPTGSGKSLILYCLVRYMQELDRQILIVCPTTQLVEQMASDFDDYAHHDASGWSSDDNVHKIYSGHSKSTGKPVVVSTWQSLVDMPVSWFSRFTSVMVDEVHNSKAKSLTGILEKCTNAKFRIGLTGSLTNSVTDKMVIHGLFGPAIKVATTRELIDKGHLTDIKISAIMLDYSADTKKALKGVSYVDEIKFLVSHSRRNNFIRNLALSMKGNTLLLFNLVESHGQVLYDLIKEKATDKQVFFIHGGVDVDERERVRSLIETNNDIIIIASVGTTSTGVNFKNLHNVIFAAPTKSLVRVLQSIGRGLRNSLGKTRMNLYDIGDKLTKSNKNTNHTYGHFVERLGIYAKEDFTYKLIEMVLEK